MHKLFQPTAAVMLGIGAFMITVPGKQQKTNFNNLAINSVAGKAQTHQTVFNNPVSAPKIQVAVLLDVSNSMDGLIAQAKSQLWNMVSVMGKARCGTASPTVEIALYEYGRSSNNVKQGYVKQINSFTTDLDDISKNLFSLSTNGGDEYCGQVIYTSLNELEWDSSPDNYKVIFIAGNEDFLQGNLSFSKACTKAKEKGVIVNTIYCGNRMQGIREHWNLGSECGTGSFTNINQDAVEPDIPTPYDSDVFILNDQLNKTYIGYGASGAANTVRQQEMDAANYSMSKSVAAKRASVKANSKVYNNAGWDLVDAAIADSAIISTVDINTLPNELKSKNRTEIKQIVKEKQQERTRIQKDISEINIKREAFIKAEKAKQASGSSSQTLETEVEKMVREQAKNFKIIIE